MELMGLYPLYKKIMNEYDANRKLKFNDTLLKMLFRCSMAYNSIHKIKKIVKLLKKKNELLSIFIKRQNSSNLNKGNLEY